MPASRRVGENGGKRYQQRSSALRGVEHPVMRGRELPAVNVGAGRREERVELAPGKEHDTRQKNEQDRMSREPVKRIDADAFNQEGDEHRVFAADVVRDPSEERSTQPVEDAIDCKRESQRW